MKSRFESEEDLEERGGVVEKKEEEEKDQSRVEQGKKRENRGQGVPSL